MKCIDGYKLLGGDYEALKKRLVSEHIIQKFLKKFPEDPSFPLLKQAMEAENYDEAFRQVHTLKGVCANLDLAVLFESSHALTEALRHRDFDSAKVLFVQVEKDYMKAIEVIKKVA